METDNKITIVAYYFGRKLGAGVFMENLYPILIKQLQEYGYKVTLITNNCFMRYCGDKLPQDIRIGKPKFLEKSLLSKIYFMFLFRYTAYSKKAKYVLFSIDSIIGWRMNNVVAIIHDLNEFAMQNKLGRFRTFFRKMMIRNTLKKAKKIIVISNFVKQQIETYLPKLSNGKDIIVIHSGIRFSDNPSATIPVNEKDPFFFIVGRIDPKAKYLYEAVKVFEIYKRTHPAYRLKIAGGINDFCRNDAEIFFKYIADIEGIDYLGYISEEDLNQLYENASATLFLSKLEGFGFPVLESFARGCPVITNGDNEVNNELSGGKDIKLFENEFENELIICEKLDKIKAVDKKELIDIASSFSWTKTANKYLDILIH